MKKEYDFSKGRRGPVIPIPAGKTRITIQKLINLALREHIVRRREPLEATLRRVLREELTERGVATAGSLREGADEVDECAKAMKRQRRTMKNAKRRGFASRPTWTRDELHERHPAKEAK